MVTNKIRSERAYFMCSQEGEDAVVCLKSDVDAAIAELNERDRKLKRALWLARAAMCRTYDIRAYFIEHPDSKRRFIDFLVLMQKAAATVAIKAEEYK